MKDFNRRLKNQKINIRLNVYKKYVMKINEEFSNLLSKMENLIGDVKHLKKICAPQIIKKRKTVKIGEDDQCMHKI